MSFRRLGSRVKNFAERRQNTRRRALKRITSRQNLLQRLEDRTLLAGPELIAIRPDAEALLNSGDTLNIAPREFNLLFKGGADIDASTATTDSIKLIRSGGDGSFIDGNEIEVALGYVGLVNPTSTSPSDLQRLVFRPASSASHNANDPTFAFPDDTYQIQIVGEGDNPLTNRSGEAFEDGTTHVTTFELDRGAQVVAVVPQPISQAPFSQASDEIVVYFDDQPLDATEVLDPSYYRLVNTGATLQAGDDSVLLPQTVNYDEAANRVTLKFAAAIPEGTYRLDIGQSGANDSALSTAVQVGSLLNGTQFRQAGYLGDANGRSDDVSDVDLLNLQLQAGSTLNLTVTPQSSTLNLRVRVLSDTGLEIVDSNEGVGLENILSLAIATTGNYFVEISSADASTGAYSVNASVSGAPVSTNDNNSTFSSATSVGALGAATKRITSSIRRQPIPLPPRPGSEDEPGNRQIQREQHVGATGTTPTLPAAVRQVNYYFPDTIGRDTSGTAFVNLITEKEKQIVREIFEIYSQLSGYEFVESPASTPGGDQLMIAKGDMRAVDPTLGPGMVGGLASGGFAVLDGSIFNDSNRFFGDGFTATMFHEIGHSLGLGHSYDIPSNMGAGVQNDVLPGDYDVMHLQRIAPPNSTDIDMYEFTLDESGVFSAETIAERLPSTSLLNTAISLYRRVGDEYELVARNDQYFGADSYISLRLDAGTYYVGVSSTGNTDYDPRVPDSGFGGTTDGVYDLQLSFQADRSGQLADAQGTPIDGDLDGAPGGTYSFWFQASDPATAIYVSKTADTTVGPEGSGTLADPYDTIEFALDKAGKRIVVPTEGASSIAIGESFTIDDGVNQTPLRFGTAGLDPIDISGATSPIDVANAIQAAIDNAKTNGRLLPSVTATLVGRTVEISGINNLDVSGAPTLLNTPNLVHILADAGLDNDVDTLADNRPYLVGFDTLSDPLPDGAEFLVPQGVTAMVQAGTLFKMRKANLDAGTSSSNIERGGAAIQVLGTPERSVFFRSYHNDSVGGNSDGPGPEPSSGDFGGIVFRDDSDMENEGVFLNYVNHADINNGGGRVFVDANELLFTPIHVVDARPTVSFNLITSSNGAAISASPDSFDDSLGRIGPDVQGNFLVDNTIDAMFIRVVTPLGGTINKLDVSGRFDDTDIPHVLSDNLIIAGGAGGPTRTSVGGSLVARPGGRLMIDPGVIVKLDNARIEVERGSGTLIAEGTLNRPIVFTSAADDRFGDSGSFDTVPLGESAPQPGNWGGIYFGQATTGSIDNAEILYGGGATAIEGGTASFNAIEIHQADVRVANSLLQSNAGGTGPLGQSRRAGRGANSAAAIYVRGAQPILVGNTIVDNQGAAININASSVNYVTLSDRGRSTGVANAFEEISGNQGPLVRLNSLENNSINGMLIRGERLTTEGVWDDTDIVHVVAGEIVVDNFHTFGGLKLLSSSSESLVIKFATPASGFTATGTPREIIDRIGGAVQVLGLPGKPVVMTSLSDDTIGAGFTPSGGVNFNTNNSASPSTGSTGDWRGLRFDEFSNDRNVALLREAENPVTNGIEVNNRPATAQDLGVLAPDQKSGDENRRLGFEVSGYISPTDPDDVDVYSFTGTAGTEVWIDIDRTSTALDAIVEVLNGAGTVLARSVNSVFGDPGDLNVLSLTQNPLLGGDHYTQNFRDPGFRYVLPGPAGSAGSYFIRVRSNPLTSGDVRLLAGESSGAYQLQVRLQQIQEFPGSTVRYADIRFANTGIDVRGLPARSPLVAEAGELGGESFGGAQQLVNLLETDVAALGISGAISTDTDVDWYQFELTQTGVQLIPGVNDGAGTVAVVFDIDYADQAVRADTTVAVYDENQNLVFVGRESDIADDRQNSPDGSIDDLSRGSLGSKDPYIGPIHLSPGTEATPKRYYVAVMSDRMLPSALTGVFQAAPSNAANRLVRLEPVNSVVRIVEDHIGYQGYTSTGAQIDPREPLGLFDISTMTAVNESVTPFTFSDVGLFVATDQPEDNNNFGDDDYLYTVNPYESSRWLTRVTAQGSANDNLVNGVDDIQDVAIRTDGRMFGYARLNGDGANVGTLLELDPSTGATISSQPDGIAGQSPTPNTTDYPNQVELDFFRSRRADQFTTSDDVDALAFQRLGQTGPADAPVPTYDIYYSVRESNAASKLYRASEDGDASLRRNRTPAPGGAITADYGIVGDIQPPGVSYTTRFLHTEQPVQNAPNPISRIRLRSKIAGAAGEFDIVFTGRPNNTNVNVDVAFGGNVPLIRLTVGLNNNNAPSAAAIVDAINNDPEAGPLVTAVIESGNADNRGHGANGTSAVIIFEDPNGYVPGDDGPNGPLQGRVTGLSFANWDGTGNLFGVTDAGEFLEIEPATAVVINRVTAADTIGIQGMSFQGLTLGPQNVEGGVYKNTLFAVTDTGRMVAFDTNGNGFFAFASGDESQVLTTASGATDGFFTLTSDVGIFGRQTTDPIAVDAPATVTINETQMLRTVGGGFGGTFTLSLVDDVGGITSPAADIGIGDTVITVQDLADFPTSSPFVINVNGEQMLVQSILGNSLTVVRGHNGTTPAAHSDTSTVFEVTETATVTALTGLASSSVTADLDAQPTSTTLTVADGSAFPVVPFVVRVGDELMQVSGVAGNDLTVQRGFAGTTVEDHVAGASAQLVSDSVTVVDTVPLPQLPGFNIRIGNEDMRVVSISGNTYTVIRGINGTSLASHASGSAVVEIETTVPLAYNASNAQVRTALANLPTVGGFGNVSVYNGALNGLPLSAPITIEFEGALSGRDLQLLTTDSSDLIGEEVQRLSIGSNITGGTFRLEFDGVETAVDLPFDITATDLQTELEALSTIGAGNVLVSGTDLDSGPLDIQFTGALENIDVNLLLAPAASENLLENEEQEFTISGNPTGGTFTLDLNDPANGITGASSLAIPYNANATAVQNAIESGIPALAGNVNVVGSSLPGGTMEVEFTGAFAATDMAQFTASSSLTGGTSAAVLISTTQTIPAQGPFITELAVGTPVSAPVSPGDDGSLSVRDALVGLPQFAAADITAAGILAPPGTGVAITFTGAYAGTSVPLLEIDNGLNVASSLASIVARGGVGSGMPGSFTMNVSGMNGSGSAPIGLAFSPLDFNLWHPTSRRGTDAGHGINDAPDETRDSSEYTRIIDTTNTTRTFDEDEGGVSYHFGFETWQRTHNTDTEAYLTYDSAVNAQHGILTTAYHQDLSSNAAIRGSYNMPAGALGSLTTKTFDLSGTNPTDRPTLYFNYFLETENYDGSDVDDDDDDPFRDSARVFISTDGGTTWELLATNNSQLSDPNPFRLSQTAELPGFLSHLSDAGLNSPRPRSPSQQIVQELFDNSGVWRQARVDLSTYAGLSDLMMRVDFSTAGSMNDDSLIRIDGEYNPANASDAAPFGEYVSPGNNPRSTRSTNNQFEGFYIDDIIIGYAERGEMVTGANADASTTNLFAGNARTRDRNESFPDIVTGEYQLEIRRTDEFIFLTDPDPGRFVGLTFDTNDRHVDTAVQTAFLNFEAGSFVPPLTPPLGGPGWSVTSTNPSTGTLSLESGDIGIGPDETSVFQVTRSQLAPANDGPGIIRFSYAVDSTFEEYGLRFFIDNVPQTLLGTSGETPADDTTLASGDTGYRTVEFSFGSGDHTFTWVYDGRISFPSVAPIEGLHKAFLDNIEVLQGATGLLADRNRDRAQGMLILDGNTITDSQNRGINVQPGAAQAGGSVPHPGSLINFPQLNSDRLIPGVVIQNNVIAGSSGIRFAGETNANPNRPIPFGRIVNNTLVGSGSGVGIEVTGRASPTLMNNLIADYATGITDAGINTVIRSNFFQDNGSPGAAGASPIVGSAGDPLFQDAANQNYYLVGSTLAIDSAQITEQDRLNYLTFKQELGIPASPINAPSRDAYGQLRIDTTSSPVADRGAIERQDIDAPYATLLNPIDNDARGFDRDPSVTVVSVSDPLMENFTILLGDGRGPNSPFEGTGVDGSTVFDATDPTVAQQAITLEQNGVPLVQGVDYNVAYNELSGVLRLTPLATLWEASSVYVVTLDNTLIRDKAGNRLRSNQDNGLTRFTIIIPVVGNDYGDAPDSYQTSLSSDGARHANLSGSNLLLGSTLDSEDDAIPSVGADGDDTTGADDEDGLLVGSFVGATSTVEGLFLADGTSGSTTDPGDVVAFLNRNDPAGTLIPVTVSGDGVLDAWIDFNADGDFMDQGEYVIQSVPVVDGVNSIRVSAPGNSAPGLTYARFRLSDAGITDPFGIAIGGEVEDYRVHVVDVDAAAPVDDSYTVSEDHVLTVDGTALTGLIDNDALPTDDFVQSRVVVEGVPIAGTTNEYRTANGVVRIDDPALGLFTYTPDLDFEGTDTFRYAVSTQRNEGPEFDAVATFATVTIEVTPFNAPPVFDIPTEIDIDEDNPSSWIIDDFFGEVLGGAPEFGLDEAAQTVTFSIQEVSSDPADLMTAGPDVSNSPGIEFFPAADATGQVIYEITATDDGVPVESLTRTLTVNVRPINDPPRFDPNVAGTDAINGPDEAWSVARQIDPVSGLISDARITYTLREDLSEPVGTPVEPFFIPFQQDTGASGYTPIGLMDVFTVGPPSEADPLKPGGGQTLSMGNVPTSTSQGGTLTLGTDGNGLPGVFYTPPQDFNRVIGSVDSFIYSVVDDGESYLDGQLVSDPKSSTNVVEFVLNPVNDKPVFGINLPPADPMNPAAGFRPIETLEDSPATTINSFAFSIEAGPPTTAFDETSVSTGQEVTFDINPLDFPESEAADYFTQMPTISDEGVLTFQAAPDVFGRFQFELLLTDDGPTDASRGDQNVSDPKTITIDVLPINDPPQVDPAAPELFFTIQEDASVEIFSVGSSGDPGLLDVFQPGPANEADDIVPGGNQTLAIRQPTPVETALGGTIEQIRDSNDQLIGLRYTPRANFVGTDSFTYSVIDDGVTVAFGSDRTATPDPRIATNVVTIDVLPVNNRPQFSGPANVVVAEDAGAVSVPAWAGNVLAGPPTALDELQNQDVFFTINQVSGDPALFTTAPTAVIDDVDDTAALQFETAPDANGVAIFEVQLFDIPTDGTTAASSPVRRFTLTVNAVNDVPTFQPVTNSLAVDEDSGPQSLLFAENISPGPADESDQTVTFEVVTPPESMPLFQQQPRVDVNDDEEGILRFLPAANANGTVVLTITAVDSAGGRSAPQNVTLTLNALNDRPVANSDSFDTDEDVVLNLTTAQLLANDVDPDVGNPSDFLRVQMPASSFSLNGAEVRFDALTGSITYDPTGSNDLQSLSPGESVVDSFTYSVIDSQGERSNIVTVEVAVEGVNDAPVALPDNPTLNPNGPTIIPILSNDSDIDGSIVPGTIEITLQPAFGSLSIDDNGVVTFTASQSFAVEDVFRYRVADERNAFSNEALVVISANAAPIARNDNAGTYLEETIVINVSANDEDPDAAAGAANRGLDLTSIQILQEPDSGDVVPLDDGTVRYIPDDGFVGTDTFRYTIADLSGRVSDPGVVNVNVSNSRLQNPASRTDVNDDGSVSPIDALLVINYLARSGQAAVEVTPDDQGPPFYDVDGSQLITPQDALLVINDLARRAAFGGEGEQATVNEEPLSVTGQPLDFIDLIVSGQDDDDDEERVRALDAAFGDLM